MSQDQLRVVIIGGGISGIAQAIRLQGELGHKVLITVGWEYYELMADPREGEVAWRGVERLQVAWRRCGRPDPPVRAVL